MWLATSLTLVRPKAVKEEAVSPKLVASLIHPDRSALVWSVAFSSDGSRLFGTDCRAARLEGVNTAPLATRLIAAEGRTSILVLLCKNPGRSTSQRETLERYAYLP